MENSFDLLEEKVRRAADLVKRLRKENTALEERVVALEKQRGTSAGHAKELEGLAREAKTLREEREEIRQRIAKLVEALDGLD